MEGDDRQSAARIEAVDGLFHRFPHGTQLIVYRNADRLKAALRRMLLFAQCFRGHSALDHTDKLQRGLNRLVCAFALDRRCDQRCVALLAVLKQNAADLLAAPAVYHIIRGQLLLPVHAHIERRILHIGKTALSMIQLRRGNAEVEQNAVRTCKSLPFEHLVDIAEVALDRCDTLPYILEAFSSASSSLSIQIKRPVSCKRSAMRSE